MQWIANLSGDDGELLVLSQAFSDCNCSITREGPDYYLRSKTFDQYGSSEEVFEALDSMLSAVNGAARLRIASRTRVQVASLVAVDDRGERQAFIRPYVANASTTVIPAGVQINHLSGSQQFIPPAESVRKWVEVSATDNEVADVLHILGSRQLDWRSLYWIFDAIEQDCRKDWTKVDPSVSTWERDFTMSANNRKISGVDGRHGADMGTPKRPGMSLSQATECILQLVNAWIKAKIEGKL